MALCNRSILSNTNWCHVISWDSTTVPLNILLGKRGQNSWKKFNVVSCNIKGFLCLLNSIVLDWNILMSLTRCTGIWFRLSNKTTWDKYWSQTIIILLRKMHSPGFKACNNQTHQQILIKPHTKDIFCKI